MSIQSGAGVKFSIGTTAAAANQTGYEGDTYSEVANVESIPDFGDNATEVAFLGLGDGRKVKRKGSKDAGNITVPYAFDGSDAGQTAMIAAEAVADDYNFKVEYPGGEVRYFSGPVASITEGVGGADSILMVNATVFINTAILKVAAP